MNFRRKANLRIILPLVMVLLLSLCVTLFNAPVTRAASGPDFLITANYQPSAFTGFLAQGAKPGSPCSNCNGGLPEPAYLANSLGCFYDSNSMTIFPLNGFLGTVNLKLSGLPSGVTSRTATSVTVTRIGYPAIFTFELKASSTATLGNATVTITGTSGSIVHTIQMPISVGTVLPPC